VVRGDGEKNAELLVLRHENAVLRGNAGRVRYEPGDRAWFAMLTRLIPRRRWAKVFLVTPATLLAGHRMLAAGKYGTSAGDARPAARRLSGASPGRPSAWRRKNRSGAAGARSSRHRSRPHSRFSRPLPHQPQRRRHTCHGGDRRQAAAPWLRASG
jgi:hypothetical protein